MFDGKTLENFELHCDVNLLTFCRITVTVLLGNDYTEARREREIGWTTANSYKNLVRGGSGDPAKVHGSKWLGLRRTRCEV